jgi:signal transduction histidine kinase
LNNIDKHARASACTVNLRCQEGQFTLEVIDDGKGFDPQDVSAESLGVGIMRDRAEKIGASIDITSKIGQGTTIRMIWNR